MGQQASFCSTAKGDRKAGFLIRIRGIQTDFITIRARPFTIIFFIMVQAVDPSLSLEMPSEGDPDPWSLSFLQDEWDHSLELFF